MVHTIQALLSLTLEARSKGEFCGDYLAFEEDCRYAVAIYEHPEWLLPLEQEKADCPQYWPGFVVPSVDEIRDTCFKVVSSWDADYLLARGITPHPAAFEHFIAMQKEPWYKRIHPECIGAQIPLTAAGLDEL